MEKLTDYEQAIQMANNHKKRYLVLLVMGKFKPEQWGIIFHPSDWRKQQRIPYDKGNEKWKLSYYTSGTINGYNQFGQQLAIPIRGDYEHALGTRASPRN